MAYDFKAKLEQGERCAAKIDEYLNGKFKSETEIVELNIDKLGIDRFWKVGKLCHSIEYKSDFTAARTGNAFIELESVNDSKPGWLYTCLAQYLLYYIPPKGEGLLVEMTRLRHRAKAWLKHREQYQQREAVNDGYHSVGLLVPLSEIREIAYQVYRDMPKLED